MLKYDLNGSLIWSKTWGGPLNDQGNSITADGEDLFIFGKTASFGNGSDYDICLLEYNLNGIWFHNKNTFFKFKKK
ncbi:MAG: hypothetical protein ACTSVC_06240 [Promethearchaeota archaeon]